MKSFTVTATVSVPHEMVRDLFISACEGGSNYWCDQVKPNGLPGDMYDVMFNGFTVRDRESKVQRQFLKQTENLSCIDMTLVGYDFLKPRVYKVGETLVTGFFRWQPYKPGGPGTEWKVKLIWIDEHTRHYGGES